jgi:RNA polymerase sigma factor (sigma-70 family)
MVQRQALAADGRTQLSRLMAEVAQGDRQAFQDLYKHTSAKLFGVILAVVHDRREAEDVLQDVFLAVWEKAHRFDAGQSSPITWLAVIARNKAIDRRRAAAGFGAEPAEGDAMSALLDESPTALDQLERREEYARLVACLEALEEHLRVMIMHAFLMGRTYEELARRNEVPLGTMKSWIRRALIRLRRCLES